MKNIKRILSFITVITMLLTVTGCHKKNEIAIKAKDLEFTSAYYMCSLITADSLAKSKINENLTEEEAQKEVDYYSQKIDGKKFEKWVKDEALDSIKEIAAVKLLCKENKLELDKETIESAEYYADYYWTQYGYSALYEPNGVSKKTFTEFMKDSYYSNKYFDFIYGKDGQKELNSQEVVNKIYDNFIIADVLQATFTSEMQDTDKQALKAKLDGYVNDLKNGKKTFEQVYNEYNNVTEENHQHSEDEDVPKDEYAQILGAKDTGYDSEYYSKIKDMAIGEVNLLSLENDAGYILVIKQDITADEYYAKNLDSTARHLMKDEEFEKSIKDYCKKFELDVNKYAVNQFKVKKIVQPDYSNAY